jgi:TonB-dependent SusC/RagA subfamily outer membrane receptor
LKLTILILLPLILVSIIGCSSSHNTVEKSGLDINSDRSVNLVPNQPDYFRSLADFLNRVPGVQVYGPSSDPMIIIRGASSIDSGIEPLYVIDGQPVGTNYIDVNSMVDVRDIDHIQVLKGSDASVYGIRGSNGVIFITTRRQ